jgi:hypothetical protein
MKRDEENEKRKGRDNINMHSSFVLGVRPPLYLLIDLLAPTLLFFLNLFIYFITVGVWSRGIERIN